MSVIFGIVEKDQIIIAGDRRLSKEDGSWISDDGQKIFEINEYLAFVTAGNAAIGAAIEMDINRRTDKAIMKTDDLIDVIENFYENVLNKSVVGVYSLPFYCLIAGLGKDGEAHLINAGKFKSGVGWKDVSMALYAPEGSSQDECNTIFAKNYHLYHDSFCEKTMSDISKINKTVSSTGNKWIYNIGLRRGNMFDF